MPGQPGVEGEADGGPEGHHQIDEHRHPGGRDVDENDPVAFALLEIGRRDEHADP
jgi:hypothetical protein